MAAFRKYWIVMISPNETFGSKRKFETEKEARQCAASCCTRDGDVATVLTVVAQCHKQTVTWDEATDGPAPF